VWRGHTAVQCKDRARGAGGVGMVTMRAGVMMPEHRPPGLRIQIALSVLIPEQVEDSQSPEAGESPPPPQMQVADDHQTSIGLANVCACASEARTKVPLPLTQIAG